MSDSRSPGGGASGGVDAVRPLDGLSRFTKQLA
jgi:hypothetical protein